MLLTQQYTKKKQEVFFFKSSDSVSEGEGTDDSPSSTRIILMDQSRCIQQVASIIAHTLLTQFKQAKGKKRFHIMLQKHCHQFAYNGGCQNGGSGFPGIRAEKLFSP